MKYLTLLGHNFLQPMSGASSEYLTRVGSVGGEFFSNDASKMPKDIVL